MVFSAIGVFCVILCQTFTIEWMDIVTSTKISIKYAFFDFIKYGAPQANLPLWFLLSLFTCRILMNIMVNRFSKRMLFISLLVIVAIMQVVDCIDSFDNIPLYLKNIPVGLSLMIVGYLVGKDVENKYFWASLATYLFILIIYPSHLSVFAGAPKSGIFFTGYVALVSGCISIKGIASLLSRKSVKIANFFNYIGKHSMPYYCLHWILLLTICYIPIGSPLPRLVCMIIACLVLLPIFEKMVKHGELKWIIGDLST
jgi:peptidoglycan/LPS O-acetylase OafA/YrhL